jgi:hypothetical protein
MRGCCLQEAEPLLNARQYRKPACALAAFACGLLLACTSPRSEPPVARDAGETSTGLPEASPPSGIDLSRIERTIADREYRASYNDRGLQAPNRAHDLRTYFDEAGIRVHERNAMDGPELFSLELVATGRGKRRTPVQPGELAHEGARVEIRRSGMVEWYENSRAGLEQGFTEHRERQHHRQGEVLDPHLDGQRERLPTPEAERVGGQQGESRGPAEQQEDREGGGNRAPEVRGKPHPDAPPVPPRHASAETASLMTRAIPAI